MISTFTFTVRDMIQKQMDMTQKQMSTTVMKNNEIMSKQGCQIYEGKDGVLLC